MGVADFVLEGTCQNIHIVRDTISFMTAHRLEWLIFRLERGVLKKVEMEMCVIASCAVIVNEVEHP